MRQKNKTTPLLWAVLAVPVLYLAALLASGYEDGMTLFDLLGRFNMLLERPFSVRWARIRWPLRHSSTVVSALPPLQRLVTVST